MPQSFPGLTDADFDAYQLARASSNAYVRPRLAVKEKALALGRALATRAGARGLSLEVSASDERPSIWNKRSVTDQWVFLWRDKAAREELERAHEHERALDAALQDPSPYHRHAFLALRLDAARLEVTVRVHRDAWADVKNTRRRLETPEGRAAFTAALVALGPDYELGVTSGDAAPAREADAARVAALLDAAVASGDWLYVTRPMSRADAVAAAPEALEAWITDAFDALVPIYALVAWRREDDHAAVSAELERERAAREAQAAALAAREAQWQAEQNAEIERRRAQAVTEARERAAALESVRPGVVQNATRASDPRLRTPAAPFSRPSAPPRTAASTAPPRTAASTAPAAREPNGQGAGARNTSNPPRRGPAGVAATQPVRPAAPTPPPVEWVESAAEPVRAGARIRVRSGPFAGRVGVVVDVDGRGEARVSLGPVSARIEVERLVALVEKRGTTA